MSGVSGRGEEEVEQDVEVGEHEGEEWMIVWDDKSGGGVGDRLDNAEPINDVGDVQDEGASSGKSWWSSESSGWISRYGGCPGIEPHFPRGGHVVGGDLGIHILNFCECNISHCCS